MLDITTSCRTCMKDSVRLIDLYEIVKIEENCLQLSELLVQCTQTEVCTVSRLQNIKLIPVLY